MRKPEALSDKLWRSVSVSLPGRAKLFAQRYRGVILVVSIPIILILAVVMLVPRKSPLHYDQTHTVKELQHKTPAGAPGGSSSGKDVYAVVLDAGSTGSRVHVYRFAQINGENRLISDTFEQLKPGLSSFADDPKAAAQSLKPLLDKAVETVPKDLQASTPVSLKATAGLRLLPEGKAPKILEAVEEFLGTYPFQVNDGAVAILDGKDEGAFAWLTLNYLLGNLAGGDIGKTVAAIDLGGGSVQEAFAVSDAEAKAAPEGYISKLKAGGKTYNVYVHSYLGYGLMASRAKVISGVAAAQGHPCFHKDVPATNYTYAGQDYPFRGHATAAHKACSATGQTALEAAKQCGAAQVQCSFNGAWRGQPNVKAKPYFVSSYFWDRALESGIITDPKAVQWPTTPQAFGAKAEAACGKNSAEVSKAFPAVKPDQATFFCLDLSFSYTLLTKGFQLPESKTITLVKQVEYNGQNIEAAWPLGAAINDL